MKYYGFLAFFYLFIAGTSVLGYRAKWQFNYPSKVFFETYGLDVSHHQGEVEWEKVNTDKYKFVYLKATEGESFKDKRFFDNSIAARKAGLVVGAYHFWSLCKSVDKQINNLIEAAPPQKGDLVPAIDIESITCKESKDSTQIGEDLNLINIKIKQLYGVKPVIYTTREFARAYPKVLDFENFYWLRSLIGRPLYKKNWALWQYYNGGVVRGFKGPVDLNVLNKKVLLESIIQI